MLRHLADITTYPANIKSRLKAGAWVSALKDGRGVTLARDEYHEWTASLDIQVILPKQLTAKNMQVLTQYVTYGATARRNLLDQIFPKKKSSVFKLSKGCTVSWINSQERHIAIFQKILSTEKPFAIMNRILYQPFTSTVAKDCTRREVLGRSTFGDPRKDYGKEIVFLDFCNSYLTSYIDQV